MPEEAPPSQEAVAAAAKLAAKPPPPAPEPEIEELPEGDTFPREYVEKLRNEAAKHRTRSRDVEAAFEGYTEAERTRYLELAAQIRSDPESAYEEFVGVTERLAKQIGKETTVTDPAPTPDPAPEPTPEPVPGLSESDIDRIVTERLAAEKQAQEQQSEVDATLAEAEALDEAYKDPVAKANLFAVAQVNGVGLAEAHNIIQGKLQDAIDAAVADAIEGLASGKKFPPRLPSGEGQTGGDNDGPPTTLEEAGRRAKARLNAAFEQGG